MKTTTALPVTRLEYSDAVREHLQSITVLSEQWQAFFAGVLRLKAELDARRLEATEEAKAA
jgi:hypothetical protein